MCLCMRSNQVCKYRNDQDANYNLKVDRTEVEALLFMIVVVLDRDD